MSTATGLRGRFFLIGVLLTCCGVTRAAVIEAGPGDYRQLLPTLRAGDTLRLAPGVYPRLYLNQLRGTPSAWITITGPDSGEAAVIQGQRGYNTVEIVNCSYVAIRHLHIDSLGIAGATGIKAGKGLGNLTHHILIEANTFVGQGGSQGTVGIATQTPTWGWVIRRNTIVGPGTGLYLGNSDGTCPFIAGVIENNLVKNPIGYCMQVKWQKPRPAVPDMPEGDSRTIIRDNVFIKNDVTGKSGDRPNLLVGGFPDTGPGSGDLYEIYGNFFYHNPREALLQVSGRATVHDNVFVDGGYTAMVFRNHDLPLKLAHVYNNTVYSSRRGIRFSSMALEGDSVTGNAVFAQEPISGYIVHQDNNLIGTLNDAARYLNAPSFDLSRIDFYPRKGMPRGPAIDLTPFSGETAFDRDFNRLPKSRNGTGAAFPGAYAGEGPNPGWKLQAALKRNLPLPASIQLGIRMIVGGARLTDNRVALTGPAGDGGLTVKLTSSDPDLVQVPGSVTVAAGEAFSNSFPLLIARTGSPRQVLLSATWADVTASAWLFVRPVSVRRGTHPGRGR